MVLITIVTGVINQLSYPGGPTLQATYKLHLVTAAGGRNVDAAQLAQSVPSMAVEDAVAGNAGAGKTYYVPEGHLGSGEQKTP